MMRSMRANIQAACLTVALVGGLVAPAMAGRNDCAGDCDSSGAISMGELVLLTNAALAGEASAACGVQATVVVDHVVQSVSLAQAGCPVPGTATPTPTLTNTPTLTPTRDPNAPLGRRHFEINPANGGFFAALGGGLNLRLGGFRGQSNGVAENAFMDIEAGVPDPQTGVAVLSVVDSSEYLVAQAAIAGANFTVCIALQPPIANAGVIDCDGGSDYSISLRADHHLGEIGVDGFTADDCTAMGGVLEEGARLCKAGKEDFCRRDSDCDTMPGTGDGVCGLQDAMCVDPPTFATCRNDSACDSAPGVEDGQCGQTLPHIGVCNSRFIPSGGTGDTGPGSLTFAPISGLAGLPARLNLERALPCGDEGLGQPLGFALTSTRAQAIIQDVSNNLGQTLNFALEQATGATVRQFELQNFSCEQWTNPQGPGCLGLVAPVLHQNMGADVVTAFKLCGR